MKHIRIIILIVFILPYSVALALFGYIVRPFKFGTNLLQITCKFWGQFILWGLSIRIDVIGENNLEYDRPQLILCNHQSNLDPLLLWHVKPRVINMCFAAKEVLFKIPIFGRLLHHNRSVVIDRLSPKTSLKRLFKAFEEPPYVRSLVIFPEGTRNTNNDIMPFKKGPFILAKKFNLRIVPVRISGSLEAFPKGKAMPLLGSTLKVTCFPAVTEIEVSSMDVDELTAKVHNLMSGNI